LRAIKTVGFNDILFFPEIYHSLNYKKTEFSLGSTMYKFIAFQRFDESAGKQR
jgi:hypothetical protein